MNMIKKIMILSLSFLSILLAANISFCSHALEQSTTQCQSQFPVHEAARTGDLNSVRLMVDRSIAIDTRDTYLQTPFHVAAENGHLPVVKFLADQGGLVNAQDITRKTPFHHACENGHMEIVTYLFNRGIDIISQDHSHMSPLHDASKNGHAHVVQFLLGTDTYNVNSKNIEGYSSLHLAAENGYLEVARCLIHAGADIEARTVLNEEYNTDYDSETQGGSTALHLACKNGHTKIAELLLQHNADEDSWERVNASLIQRPLFVAIKNGHFDTVRCLIEAGALKNDIGPHEDKSALHYAVEGNNIALVEFLLQTGEEYVDSKDDTGSTPLHYAAACYSTPEPIVRLLVKAGAQIMLNSKHQTPLGLLLDMLAEYEKVEQRFGFELAKNDTRPKVKYFVEIDMDISPNIRAILDHVYPEHTTWLKEKKHVVQTLLQDTLQLPRDIVCMLFEFIFNVNKKRKRSEAQPNESDKKSRN